MYRYCGSRFQKLDLSEILSEISDESMPDASASFDIEFDPSRYSIKTLW